MGPARPRTGFQKRMRIIRTPYFKYRAACMILIAVALSVSPTSFAQTNSSSPSISPTPSPSNPVNARIDQLITECRELMMKGTFEGIAQKGEEALRLSRETGDKLRQARSLMYVALGKFHAGQTEE